MSEQDSAKDSMRPTPTPPSETEPKNYSSKEVIIGCVEETLKKLEKFTVFESNNSLKPWGLEFKDASTKITGVCYGDYGKINWNNFYSKARIFKKRGPPLFSVVSHNCAHHMSCFLAINAFERTRKKNGPRVRVVINFDAHEDNGGILPFREAIKNYLEKEEENYRPPIDCRNWGRHVITNTVYTTRKEYISTCVADYYVVLGVKGGKVKLYHRGKEFGGMSIIDLDTKFAKDGKINEIMDKIMNEIIYKINRERKARQVKSDLEWKDFNVYVTVDRDFMYGSCTTYGDGDYGIDFGRDAVKNLLEILARKDVNGACANLVGFDVTGLPCGKSQGQPSPMKNWTGWDEGENTIISNAMDDISTFFTAVNEYYEPKVEWQEAYFDMSKQILVQLKKSPGFSFRGPISKIGASPQRIS